MPDDVLVLPSHNEPFQGLHARLEQLIAGHEQRPGASVHELLAQPNAPRD